MLDEKITNEQSTDLVEEAGALAEMSKKVQELEAKNAELNAAKKKYYDAVLNGGTEPSEVHVKTLKEAREDLWSGDVTTLSNRQYAEKALELDNACIRETGESCFLPKGKGVTPTVDERDVAERMHKALEYCLENSDNDKDFNLLWARCIKK